MSIKRFLKDKLFYISTQLMVILAIGAFLYLFHMSRAAIILIGLVMFLSATGTLVYEYSRKNRYYGQIYRTLEQMPQKQYIAQLLDPPGFLEAEILEDILKQVTKAMNDAIAAHINSEQAYKTYIETWIHEIKIPFACVELICKNNKDEVTTGILEEMNRIDGYVEQVLFYARSTHVEKDYVIKSIVLESLVKAAVKKHSKQLIGCKAILSFDHLDKMVYGDSKWLEFILGQLIANSLKYRKEQLALSFSARDEENKTVLSIKDNGVGIPLKDLTRVFERGFTGENGRQFAKSTGMGLYLCKSLCEKMYLGLEVLSEETEGTEIQIIFPKDSRSMLEE